MKIYLNSDHNDLTWNKTQYLLAADKRLGLNVYEQHRDNSQVEEYVLNVQPFTFRTGTKWTGLWHIDVTLDSDIPEKYYGDVDTIFIASSQSQWNNPKQRVLFQAADLELHKPDKHIPKNYDFIMCGSMDSAIYMPRKGIFDVLKNRFNGHDFGKGFAYNKYISKYNEARVQWIHPGVGPGNKTMAAQRIFESMAIGPTLTYWTEDLPLLGLVDGKDFITYKSSEEALQGMEKLLDPVFGEKVFKSGREKIALYHTYEHRAMSIINTIKYL